MLLDRQRVRTTATDTYSDSLIVIGDWFEGIACYFNWSAKKQASLIFPSGRTIPGDHEHLVDGSNLQRMMYFADLAEVDEKAEALRHVIDAYVLSR